MAGLVAAADDPSSDLAPGPRRKVRDAASYLEVAPSVVAVARELDVRGVDLTLPRTPSDPDRVVQLAERWALDSPMARLVEALTNR
jgi:hypothetical protein